MPGSLVKVGGWLRRRAQNAAVALLATVFLCFILQIVFRYLLGWPVGWTLEVSTLAWTWLVLWGAAFVVTEKDEIRFDILYGALSARVRRGFVVANALAIVTLFAGSLPAVIDYVTFMKVERASYIGVRLDYLFSVYILFAVAVIVRYLWHGWWALRGETSDFTDPSHHRDE